MMGAPLFANRATGFCWQGLKVYVNDDLCVQPKVRVSAAFERTQHPDLVRETQEWMNEFFGVEYHVFKMGNEALVMSSRTYKQLRKQLTNAFF